MNVLQPIETNNHFITENTFRSPIKPHQSFQSQNNLNKYLPSLVPLNLTINSKELMSYQTPKHLKSDTLSILREFPSLTCFNTLDSPTKSFKKRSSSKPKKPVDEYYDQVFHHNKELFKAKKDIVNNKYNLSLADNEEQYQKKMIKIKLKRMKEGQTLRNEKNINKALTERVNGIKTKITFMKSVVDFTYPMLIVKKNRMAYNNNRRVETETNVNNNDNDNDDTLRSDSPKIIRSRTNGCDYTKSYKDNLLREDNEKLGMFLLQAVKVKKCTLA